MALARRQKMSLVALAVALSIVASVVVLRPTKPIVTLRDPSTLPHVDRPFPKITSNVPLDENATSALLGKFQKALDRDPTSAGSLKITFARDAQNQLVAQVASQSGNLDAQLRWEIQNDPPTVSGLSVPLLLTFSSEPKHEPVAPGGNAADNVIRKQLEHAPLTVRSTRLKSPYWDGFVSGNRVRSGNLEVDVELSESRVYEVCGSIRDFMPAEGSGPPCPKAKHLAGDQLREVESKKSLF